MPLTKKGQTIESAMEDEYGHDKGESVFYASKNKGTITGVTQGCGRNKEFTASASRHTEGPSS